MRPNSYRSSYNPQQHHHQQPPQPPQPPPSHPTPPFIYPSQFRSNSSSSSSSSSSPHSRSRDEAREERDLRMALLASQQDHQSHLIELERRERLMIEQVRKESELAEADRIELEKARLASIEETERKILESVLRESESESKSNQQTDNEQFQLELALAISLNHQSSQQIHSQSSSSSSSSSSYSQSNNLHHLQPVHPIPLSSTQSVPTLERLASRSSSFTTALTEPDRSDSFNHSLPPRSTTSSYQSSSSFIPQQNTGDSTQECPPPYDDIGPSRSSAPDPQSSIHISDPSASNPILNTHSPPQSFNRDYVLTPTGTSSELQSNRTIRRHSRPLPQPPSRPNSQLQSYPLESSPQPSTSHHSPSLRLSTPESSCQSSSIRRVSHPYATPHLVSNQLATPIAPILNPFEDCYAASPIEDEDRLTSLTERPALLIRSRSDQFVPFPDFQNRQEQDPTDQSNSLGTPLRVDEEEEDEAIKEALIRARRASNYSGSFTGLESEENDVFESHEGSEGTSIRSPSTPSSFSDHSRTFVCNPRPSGSLSEGVKYGMIAGTSHHPLESGQFPDVIGLTRFALDGSPLKENGFFVIEAWNWNQLLTYFMWHGNSRIEAGPLDVADADENRTNLQLALCVEFIQTESPSTQSNPSSNPSTRIRLILEFVSGVLGVPRYSKLQSTTPEESSRPELHRSRKSSSRRSLMKSKSTVSFQSTSAVHDLNSPKGSARSTRELIELPKPYLDLPMSLSTLASSLHEIHTVARMTACSSTTSSFLSSSKAGMNTEKLKRLAKSIERQGEGEENVGMKEEALMKKGRRWLRRKRKGFLGEIGGNETQKVDGVGLPLPNGATLVQPFDSDWS